MRREARRSVIPLVRFPLALGLSFLIALPLSAGVTSAHPGIGTVFDAPVPLPLLFAGAALTVAATAGYLAASDRDVRTGERHLLDVGRRTARTLRTLARVGFFLVFVAALLDGLFGRQVQLENLATVLVWPLWLKGVALVAVFAGSPWRVLSPWRTLYLGISRLEGGELSLWSYPPWLGSLPALLGVLALGFVENLTVLPRDPALTAALLAAFALAMLLGGVLFGPEWFERGDPLAVLYRLFGRVRVLDVRLTDGGYALSSRPPWRGTLAPVPPAEVGVVVASVFVVSFDGFRETPEFQSLAGVFRDLLGPGLGAALPVYVLGLLVFAGAFSLAAALTARALGGSATETACRLAPTVLPIAAAYELAHNVDYLLVNAAALVDITGSWVGLSVSVEPTALLSLPVYWGGQVTLVVLGHLVAVVAAHAVLRGLGERVGPAHLPLTAVMVAYTLVSLWILSRPVVG
jgi:hypothetical protein